MNWHGHYINGATAAISRLNPVVASADAALHASVPAASQPFFNRQPPSQPAHFYVAGQFVSPEGLAQAVANIPNGNAAVHPWAVQAQTACTAMQSALNNTAQRPVFGGWYGSENKFNLANLQNLVVQNRRSLANIRRGHISKRHLYRAPIWSLAEPVAWAMAIYIR